MKKIRYSAGVKAIVTLLQESCSIVLVICIILISTLFDRSMLDFSDLKNKTFTESEYYEELFQNAVAEIMSYVEYQEQFETDGVYNSEKAVNIMAYMDSNSDTSNVKTNLNSSEMFRYYLADLESWSKEYALLEGNVYSRLYLSDEGKLCQIQQLYINGDVVWEQDSEVQTLKDVNASLQELIVSETGYHYGTSYNPEEYQTENMGSYGMTIFSEVKEVDSDADAAEEEQPASERAVEEELYNSIQKVEDGKLFELLGEELKEILADMNLINAETNDALSVIEEKYLPVDGISILDEFLKGSITLSEMKQAYASLQYTLNTIGTEITAYKRLVNKYENGNSNLQFLVYSEEKNQTYTNMTMEMVQDLLSYGNRLGSYFYYNANDIRLDTSVGGMEDMFYEHFESGNDGYNSVIFVGVDTEFPNKDSFWEAREEYNQLQPWVMVSLVAAIVSVFGFFFTFIYLSLAAGRRPEDDEIHLIWFDKLKTEFWVVGFGVVCLGMIGVFAELIRLFNGSDMIGMMIMAGGMTFVMVAVFMVFYTGLVRRIRAGIMWSGSLLCWIGRGIQKVIRNWKPLVKILVAFAIHIILTLVMAVLAIQVWWYSGRYNVFFLFLILAAYLLLCGAEALIFLREGVQRNIIIDGIKRIAGGDLEYEIDTDLLKGDNKIMGEAVNTIGEGLYHAVDDSMKNERLKADLITNVSHDIKTPLTSIINYVDLLKREDLDNERAKSYINVLDAKSQRLKQLTEDLVEASKISSGNITLQMDRLNFVELVYQTGGEFNEKFEARGLTAITRLPKEPVIILADGRRIWRVIENLYNNVAKYAMENTRVYVDMEVLESVVAFSIKNISQQPLNIEASELTERFIRGDVSRSTEGSGLGLSIAQNLTKLMGGTFDIYLDGDLFKVTVTFPVAKG